MRTVHCPLCGLRFARATELDEHARDAHTPPLSHEDRTTVVVPRSRHVDRPVDQVLARRR